MSYRIEDNVPLASGDRVDMAVVTETLRTLKPGQSFLIGADELAAENGEWTTTAIGQRIQQAARRLGIRVRTKKVRGDEPGLRVWRKP